MSSVVDTVTDFASDVVDTVGDIGQSVIDAGSQVVDTVSTAVSDVAQTVGEAAADMDKAVHDNIPGGWATVGAVVLTIASGGTVNLEGETLALEAGAEVAAGTEGVGLTSGAVDATLAEGLNGTQAALEAAGQGAVKGAAIGAAKSAITGGDPLQGALTGAVAGGLGGGFGNYASGLTEGTDLADYSRLIGSVAGGTAAGAGSAAVNGRDPLTGALIGAVAGGTSNLASNIMPTDVNPAITSAGLGAIKAGLTGGDPVTGALTSAGGSLLGQGVGAGYDAGKGFLAGLNNGDTNTPASNPEYDKLVAALGGDKAAADAWLQGQNADVQKAYAPTAGVTAEFIGSDVPTSATPLVTPKDSFPDKSSPTGFSNNDGQPVNEDGSAYKSPLDAALTPIIDDNKMPSNGGLPSNTSTPSMPEGYSSQPPNLDRPMAYTADMPPEGTTWAYNNTTGERISVPVNGGGNGNSPIDAGNGGSGNGSGNGPVVIQPVLPPSAGGGSGSGGSGGGGGLGGIGSGLGSIVGGTALAAQQLNNQATNPGLTNLTPGLTKTMDYDLAGLSHYATGGSTTSKTSSSLFNDNGEYNYGNISDTPLTAALTKHNVGYTLSGLPTKADGGIMENQFGFNDGHFGVDNKFEPQFYSEGGASLNNRYVKGAGDGTSDSIPAMLANGEFVIPADVVSNLGNGSNDSGAKILDEFLRVIREHKRKASSSLPPDSKGPLSYLTDAKRKARK